MPLYAAQPLNEEAMELFMCGEPVTVWESKRNEPLPICGKEKISTTEVSGLPEIPAAKRALSDPFSRVPLFGCAFNGAVALAIHVKDAAVLVHAPKSCIWFSQNGFTGYARRGFYDRGILYPAFLPRNLEATDITMQDAVFGGIEKVREKAYQLARNGTKAIIAITSCIPGLSGDNLISLKEEVKKWGCEWYVVPVDGIEEGDYNEGMAACYKALAKEAVNPTVRPEEEYLNLVYEKTWSSKTDINYMIIRDILEAMNIKINCRFICASCLEDICHFLKAPYSILVQKDMLGQEIKKIFEEKYGCCFLEDGLPKGFLETAQWVRMIGKYYGKQEKAEKLIEKQRILYEKQIRQLLPVFDKKKVLIFFTHAEEGWLLELAEDMNLDVVSVILMSNRRNGNSGWDRRFSAHWDADRACFESSVKELKPDIIFLDDPSAVKDIPDHICVITIERDMECGFFAGINCAMMWKMKLEHTLEGRWKDDKHLFEKYYC